MLSFCISVSTILQYFCKKVKAKTCQMVLCYYIYSKKILSVLR